MAAFYYFFSGVQSVPENLLKRLGIFGLPEQKAYSSIGVVNAVEGKSGVILFPEASRYPGYFPDTQVWARGKDFWIGWEKDSKPVPEDLRREQLASGHQVLLEDGNLWTIPLARRFPVGTALPENLILSEDGVLKTETMERFKKISSYAEEVFNAVESGKDGLPYDFLWKIAVEALSINYRLDAFSISALRLITTTNIIVIAEALIDLPTIEQVLEASFQKKSIGEESSLTVG